MAAKTQHAHDYQRRVQTEMPDKNYALPTDINGLADKAGPRDEDLDDIDFGNYKGIYANNEHGQKYQCPDTGAHFEFKDLCRRIVKIAEKRKVLEEEIYGKQS